MALFRYHRGGLQESLDTTVVVSTLNDLEVIIALWHAPWATEPFQVNLNIKPYPSEMDCFDKRIGWYTHVVTSDLHETGKFVVIGFLSEALD
jgi:hypothetical protein